MNKLAKKMVAGGYLTPQKVQEIEKRAEQFVDELSQDPRLLMRAMTKVAAPGRSRQLFGETLDQMRGRAPEMLSLAALSAIAGGLGSAAESAFRQGREKITKAKNYNQMMEANPHLADMDSTQVQRAFNTLHGLNPHYASDPLVAGEFIKQTLGQESLNLAGLGNIAKARKDLSDSSRGGGAFGPEFFASITPKGRVWDPRERDWMAAREQRDVQKFEGEAQRADAEEARRAAEHGWKGEESERKRELHPFSLEKAPYDTDIAREKAYQEPFRSKYFPETMEAQHGKTVAEHERSVAQRDQAREEQRGSNVNFLRAQQEHANAIEAFKAEEAKRKFWEGAEAVSPEDPRVDQ